MRDVISVKQMKVGYGTKDGITYRHDSKFLSRDLTTVSWQVHKICGFSISFSAFSDSRSSLDILVDTLVVLHFVYDDDGGAHVGDCLGVGHTCSSCLVDGRLMMPLELWFLWSLCSMFVMVVTWMVEPHMPMMTSVTFSTTEALNTYRLLEQIYWHKLCGWSWHEQFEP